MTDPDDDTLVLFPPGGGDETAAPNGQYPRNAFEVSGHPWERDRRAAVPSPGGRRRFLTALLRSLSVWPT